MRQLDNFDCKCHRRICGIILSVCRKKSACTCTSDSMQEILTCPKHGVSVPIAQQQHFRPGPTCPLENDLVNSACPNPEFSCPGYLDAYFLPAGTTDISVTLASRNEICEVIHLFFIFWK